MSVLPGPPVRADVHPGGARLRARDWPGAAPVAAVLLALGVPLVVWSAVTGHAVEAGGGAVFTGVGAFAAWLALAKRRDVVVHRTADGLRVRGTEGAGPFRRHVDLTLPESAEVAVLAFATPDGAPEIADRGGDLVLAVPGTTVRLARCAGPGARDALDAAAGVLRQALAKDDLVGRVA